MGLMAFGTAGSGAPNYGKLFGVEIVNPGTFTDATADTTDVPQLVRQTTC